jgi:hypothetical protein
VEDRKKCTMFSYSYVAEEGREQEQKSELIKLYAIYL